MKYHPFLNRSFNVKIGLHLMGIHVSRIYDTLDPCHIRKAHYFLRND
jgi:hypothetical protein